MSALNARYIFLKRSTTHSVAISHPNRYRWVTWRPGFVPLDKTLADVAWIGFHHLRFFSNPGYCRLFAYDLGKVVHRSTIFPRWARYPFMGADDLQIGNVWTHPQYRGRGLAKEAFNKIITDNAKTGRTFWYIVSDDNMASMSAATAVGFTPVGTGVRRKRFGIKLFGFFDITEGPPVIQEAPPVIQQVKTAAT